MRVLVVHNAYQYKGGEDSVVESEMAMLDNKGHSVELFRRHNNEIAQMCSASVAAQTLWSSKSGRNFEGLVRSFKADVVHVHNTFPLISPSIYWVANRLNVPVIQTLHNFRLLCPQAMFLREGKVCEDCLGKLPWRGAVHGCYRNSKIQSTLLAGMVSAHKVLGTWQNKVTRYIALNEFCREKFIAGGLPPERIVVKPNFVDYRGQSDTERSGFLFVGRLSAEKGLGILARAMSLLKNINVRVGGEGPDVSALIGVNGVVLLGSLSRQDVQLEMSRALAVLVPSVWYETFGLVVIEAFASGTPVIASRIGVLPCLVKPGKTGLLFESSDPTDLARKVEWAVQNPEKMAEMGRNARALYEAEFTEERNYKQLMEIYQSAIKEVGYMVKP